MTCALSSRDRIIDEMHTEAARIRAVLELSNHVAMAANAFREEETVIGGDPIRQSILNRMLDNGYPYLTPGQIVMLLN